jgi:hypothetical protein
MIQQKKEKNRAKIKGNKEVSKAGSDTRNTKRTNIKHKQKSYFEICNDLGTDHCINDLEILSYPTTFGDFV